MVRRTGGLRSLQFARRKRRQFVLKIGAALGLCAVLATGIVYVLNREALLLEQVAVVGAELESPEPLAEIVMQAFAGKYFWLIEKRSVFLFPKEKAEAQVLSAFPRLKTASLSRSGLSSLTLTVEERAPVALWCGENRLGEGSTPACYFLDAQGFVYALAPAFTGDVYLRLYGPLIGSEPVGQSFLTPTSFEKLRIFMDAIRARNVAAEELALTDEKDAELYLTDGTKVLLDPSEDLLRVLDNLLSVLASETFKNRSTLNLDYIDLRFGNKVYYKE
jgi:cell division septal protein FtsQ